VADLFQGSALPNVSTTQTQSTTAPDYYTNYLSNLASQGQTAAQNAQFVGPTALQNQAFQNVAQNVGNYQPYLNQAQSLTQSAAGINPLATAQPYIQSAADQSASSAAQNFINQAVQQNPAAAANPYLQSAGQISGLNAANPYLSQAGQTSAANVGQYLNPYTQNVVSEIGRLGQQNIQETLAPQATAGAVGSGQFGSQRGAQVLGQTLRDALANISGQQANALSQGYGQALSASQADLARQAQLGQTAGSLAQGQQANLANLGQISGGLTNQQAQNLLSAGSTTGQLTSADLSRILSAGQTAGSLAGQTASQQLASGAQMANLAGQQQNLGLQDVNALSTLGAQQQQIAQNQQLFPLQNLATESNLLKGLTVPTSVSSQYTGPMPGAYQASPLQQIAGLGSTLSGLYSNPTGSNQNLISQLTGSNNNTLPGLFNSLYGGVGSGLTSLSNALGLS
jgi:hypothetical protein